MSTADLGQALADLAWSKIQEHDQNRPRSRQKTLGPSQVGHACDRKIGFQLARTPKANEQPSGWSAIKGTALHKMMESVLATDPEWITEKNLSMGGVTKGSCDAFHVPTKTVTDWKFAGTSMIKKYKREGISEQYSGQTHLYGLGWVEAGFEVKNVALVFIPGDGAISERWGWSEAYNPFKAQALLDRYSTLADYRGNPRELEATPGDYCRYCPFFGSNSEGLLCNGNLKPRGLLG